MYVHRIEVPFSGNFGFESCRLVHGGANILVFFEMGGRDGSFGYEFLTWISLSFSGFSVNE